MTQIFIEARYEKTSEYVFLNTIIKDLGFSATLQRINQELQSNGIQADGIFLFPDVFPTLLSISLILRQIVTELLKLE